MSKNIFAWLLLAAASSAFAFNDDFTTGSSLEVKGERLLTARFISNLPYSACAADDPPVTNGICKEVSLRIGSPMFYSVFNYNGTYNHTNLTHNQFSELIQHYSVGSQTLNRDWSLPTLGQLQWMIDNNVVKPAVGERFWAVGDNLTSLKKVSWKDVYTTAYNQTDDQASVHRLAHQTTPSVCKELECTNFKEPRPFNIRVIRNNAVHDMWYRIEYSDGARVYQIDGWSRTGSVTVIPATAKWVNFTWSKKSGSSMSKHHVTQTGIIDKVNWTLKDTTLCWISGGSLVSVTIGSSPHAVSGTTKC
ncbi:MAG: hypothetical protein ACRC24_03345 [Vibrionaceae bacterium]